MLVGGLGHRPAGRAGGLEGDVGVDEPLHPGGIDQALGAGGVRQRVVALPLGPLDLGAAEGGLFGAHLGRGGDAVALALRRRDGAGGQQGGAAAERHHRGGRGRQAPGHRPRTGRPLPGVGRPAPLAEALVGGGRPQAALGHLTGSAEGQAAGPEGQPGGRPGVGGGEEEGGTGPRMAAPGHRQERPVDRQEARRLELGSHRGGQGRHPADPGEEDGQGAGPVIEGGRRPADRLEGRRPRRTVVQDHLEHRHAVAGEVGGHADREGVEIGLGDEHHPCHRGAGLAHDGARLVESCLPKLHAVCSLCRPSSTFRGW